MLSSLIEKFRGVALERIERLDNLLVDLETNEPVEEEMARELHTLKGESKMLGFSDVNLVAHLAEDVLLRERTEVSMALLEEAFDVIRSLLTKSAGAMSQPIDLVGFVSRCHIGNTEVAPKRERPSGTAPRVSAAPQTGIRVELEKLERVAEVASELLLSSRRLTHQLGELNTARREVDSWFDQNAEMLPLALQREADERVNSFVAVETELQDVTQTVEVAATALEEQSRQLRHIRVDTVFQHYPRAVRDLAKINGKQVEFTQSFGDVEVDRAIAHGLSEPLLHLIRNAVDHGVETPQERVESGKSEHGVIELSARYTGSTIDLELRDDGRGIDAEALKRTAVERQFATEAQVAEMSDAEAIALIFESGFSTKQDVTDVSGRGIGMDIVRRDIAKIGGSIEIESEPGKGTSFRVRVPISGLIAAVIEFRLGDARFCIAGRDIMQVVSISAVELFPTMHGFGLEWQNEVYDLVDWRSALDQRSAQMPGGLATFLLGNSYRRKFAFWVDEILDERTAITRPLDSFFDGLAAMDGLAVTDAGETIPVVSVPGVLAVAGESDGATRVRQTSQIAAIRGTRIYKVLVVEDSEVTRNLVVGILREHGFDVYEAEDGGYGLEFLEKESVDLIVSDVQMPRIDGVTMVERIRATPQLANVPIIMLTTLGSTEDKLRAMNAGANAYLVKLNFREAELIETARRLTSG